MARQHDTSIDCSQHELAAWDIITGDRWIDRDGWMIRWMDGQMDGQLDTDRQIDRYGWIDRQIDRQMDGWMDR